MAQTGGAQLNIDVPAPDATFLAAQGDPSSVDALLGPLLEGADPPTKASDYLGSLLQDHTDRAVSPEQNWGGDPSRPRAYYRACLAAALLLGRAFNLTRGRLSADPENAAVRQQLEGLWGVCQLVFTKGLFSGPNPEPGARYACAVLALTSLKSFKRAGVRGRGKGWVWYDGRVGDPEAAWSLDELEAALLETAGLPQNTDPRSVPRGADGMPGEYVPAEVLKALGECRKHIAEKDQDDLDAAQVVERIG